MLLGLVGPTATGKTAIALDIAEQLDAEIVCVDSMTVYRRLDIGTAKPSPRERARVPHHLLDLFEAGTRPTVADFQAHAQAALADIRARGKSALLTGGSGLYFRAAADALAFPPTDAAVRARLEREDPASLALRLKELDPDAAAFIDPRNVRRVARALEVIELTGRPFSSFRDSWDHRSDVLVAGLSLDGEAMQERISGRLRRMLDAGLVGEVRGLLDEGLRPWLEQLAAVGYVQAIRLIEGDLDEAGFLEQAARATRRLSRRQLSWFRRDPRVRWFEASEPGRATAGIRAYYGSSEGDGWSS
jgi:tRNA dimethylallyltransferase